MGHSGVLAQATDDRNTIVAAIAAGLADGVSNGGADTGFDIIPRSDALGPIPGPCSRATVDGPKGNCGDAMHLQSLFVIVAAGCLATIPCAAADTSSELARCRTACDKVGLAMGATLERDYALWHAARVGLYGLYGPHTQQLPPATVDLTQLTPLTTIEEFGAHVSIITGVPLGTAIALVPAAGIHEPRGPPPAAPPPPPVASDRAGAKSYLRAVWARGSGHRVPGRKGGGRRARSPRKSEKPPTPLARRGQVPRKGPRIPTAARAPGIGQPQSAARRRRRHRTNAPTERAKLHFRSTSDITDAQLAKMREFRSLRDLEFEGADAKGLARLAALPHVEGIFIGDYAPTPGMTDFAGFLHLRRVEIDSVTGGGAAQLKLPDGPLQLDVPEEIVQQYVEIFCSSTRSSICSAHSHQCASHCPPVAQWVDAIGYCYRRLRACRKPKR